MNFYLLNYCYIQGYGDAILVFPDDYAANRYSDKNSFPEDFATHCLSIMVCYTLFVYMVCYTLFVYMVCYTLFVYMVAAVQTIWV